jgi:hypothetical protein
MITFGEPEWIVEEAIMAYFKVLSQHIRAQEAQWYSSELRVG